MVLAAAIVVAALVIRLAWLAAPHGLQPDGIEYIKLAHSLVTAGRYSLDGTTLSTYRPPLYPLVIAAAESVTRRWATLLLALQCVLGAITVGLTMAVGRRFFGARTALLAGTMLACAPMTARYTALVLTETLFTFLVMLGVFAWTAQRPVAAGLVFGAAVLTRASLVPYLVLLGLASLLPAWPGRRACAQIAVAALITIAPWAARNAVATGGRWTVADAGWGTNLLLGTIDLRSGSNRWMQIETVLAGHRSEPGPGTPRPMAESSGAEVAAARSALNAIRANPVHWVLVRARQWVWLFVDTGDYLPVTSNRVSFRQALSERRVDTLMLKAGFASGTALLTILGVYGAWTARHRAVELVPLWSFPAYLAAAHLPMFVEPRYGLPLVPFLTLFAAAACAERVGLIGSRVQREFAAR